jgi:hypothetical protein
MRVFHCSNCNFRLHFENSFCLNCGHALGFDHRSLDIVTLVPQAGQQGGYKRYGSRSNEIVQYCSNAEMAACNWVINPARQPTGLCPACDLNRHIPDCSVTENVEAWQRIEASKKRLIYGILRFGLPLEGQTPETGRLTFDFLDKAMTGHSNGVITLDLREADGVERERRRHLLDEPYRTLLGHLRHESGHFFWQLIIAERNKTDEFRKMFGDEQADYQAALQTHYDQGAPADWSEHFVSAYASAHPWEDWAETWAHYLHLVAAVDTALAEKMVPEPARKKPGFFGRKRSFDPYREMSFEQLLQTWLPLSVGMNSLSRALGHPDFYPFAIAKAVESKLAFIHNAVRDYRWGKQ